MDNRGRNRHIKRQDPSTTVEARTIGGAGTHDDSGRQSNGQMKRVRALIDCEATNIFMTPTAMTMPGVNAHIIAQCQDKAPLQMMSRLSALGRLIRQ